MLSDPTLLSLVHLFSTLQGKIQEAQALFPEAVLQVRGDIEEDDCTAVLVVETNLTGMEAEALRLSKGLPETYPEPLVVSIVHQPTLVFARAGEALSIELTTSVGDHRNSLVKWNSLPVTILHMTPGDEAAKQAWHTRFQNQHIHGTWFRASTKLVKAIQEITSRTP